MENVTDETSNPFGMRPPCPHPCPGGHRAVLGYGDANADFHVIGDHPGVHGGMQTGIPFTGSAAGEQILDVLETAGFLTDRTDGPTLTNCFLSYLHPCCHPRDRTPPDAAYQEFERFFDAELRAVTADVLLPVGERVIGHVLSTYTAHVHRVELDVQRLHGRELHGRGVLVVPIKDPSGWDEEDRHRIVTAIETLRSTDYRQMVDLGRFLPGGDPYLVR